MPAEEEGEKPKQLEQECNHRADILSGSEARTQPRAGGRSLGEGQAVGAIPDTGSVYDLIHRGPTAIDA
jgi:hypothetical protein